MSAARILRNIRRLSLEISLWVLAAIYFFPIYMLVTMALKTKREFVGNIYGLPRNIQWDNFSTAWQKMNMPVTFFNGLLIVVGSMLLLLLTASLASYAIARRGGRLFNAFYIFFISGLMLPYHLVIIPLYKLMKSLGLLYTYAGVIFIYSSICIGLTVLILTGFIRNIPSEIDEAAIIDGYGRGRVFFLIIFPLLKPALASVVVINSLGIWNDLLLPFIFLDKTQRTMVTSLYNFFQNQYTVDWTRLCAASLITIVPIVLIYLLSQKYFISGMTTGALKG